MTEFMITFMASGGMTVEAENEEEARRIFESADKQEIAWRELKAGGIDITEICDADEHVERLRKRHEPLMAKKGNA